MAKTTILIAGRDTPLSDAVRQILLGQPDLQVTQRGEEAHADPLQGLASLPDILVLALGARWEDTLRAVAARPVSQRPPMIVIGNNDAQIMRRAMQAGARDFFAPPVPPGELIQSVRTIIRERGAASSSSESLGSLTAVINAKGGSGASIIAANIAHIAAVRHQTPMALVDLDLQFGALPLAFDLEQRNSLIEALNAAEQLDKTALAGYMTKHASGVHVLSAMSDSVPLPWEIPSDSLLRLLNTVRQSYAGVVVDLPRQIDPLTGLVLAQATHIILVMQQSLAHVRDAKRMLRVITASLGVPRERVLLVINRYNEKDAVQLRDIQETVNPPSVALLPNDFRAVSESLNVGVPVMEFDKNAAITKALQDLVTTFEGTDAPTEGKFKRGLRAAFGTRGG
jgi:pilus assembly protein CpaE